MAIICVWPFVLQVHAMEVYDSFWLRRQHWGFRLAQGIIFARLSAPGGTWNSLFSSLLMRLRKWLETKGAFSNKVWFEVFILIPSTCWTKHIFVFLFVCFLGEAASSNLPSPHPCLILFIVCCVLESAHVLDAVNPVFKITCSSPWSEGYWHGSKCFDQFDQ